MTVSEPKIERLPIGQIDIEIEARLRPVSDAGVESLIASITEIGVIKDPIHVRRKRRSTGETLVLMAGAHRLEAARRLGWETIPARVWVDVTDDFAKFIEIDDNLAGKMLDPLDQAEFLAERKRVYERAHPEAKMDAFKGNRHTGSLVTANLAATSFVKSTAEATGLSERNIRRRAMVGERLSRADFAALRAAPTPIKAGDLEALAKVSEPIIRADVIAKLASGEATSVRAALASLDGSSPPPDDPIAAAYKRLMTDWRRAPMAAKRSFLDEIEPELLQILNGTPELKAI